MKKYPEYKDSGIEWLGKIPAHWNKKRLKYYGYLYGGLSGKSGSDFNNEKNTNNRKFIPFINIANNTKVDVLNLQLVHFEENETQNMVHKGDIFFLMSSENFDDVGKSAVLEDELSDVYLNSFCRGIRITNNDVDSNYLNYLLASKPLRSKLIVGANGFTRINLKTDKIKGLYVLDLPLSEQTTIANFLDHKTQLIDDLIAKKERLIELLQEERTAIINQAVTKGLDPNVPMKDSGIEWLGEIPEHWEVKRLAYVGEFSKGSGISKSDLTDEGVPVLLYGDIYTQFDIVANIFVRYTSTNIVESAKEIYQNDLLLTGSGETAVDIGKCVVYTGSERAYAGGDVIILRPYKYNGLFISYVLNSDYLINEKAKLAKGGIIVHIYSSQLRNIFIPIPPINEQNEIVNFLCFKLKTIKDSIENTINQIHLLIEYKTSLINNAVTGKIDVRKKNKFKND